MPLVALLLVPSLILYFMTAEERLQLFRRVEGLILAACRFVSTYRFGSDDPFHISLRARRRWPLVTYTLAAANIGVLIAMALGSDPLGTSDLLVAWGGSFGPRTTAAERWRVFTAIFVHRGFLHLFVNIAALVQLGLLLERMVGPFTFAVVFVAAGVLGNVMNTAAWPMSLFVGAGAALCGLYGLLFAASLRGMLQSTALRVPLAVLKTLVPTAAMFGLYCLMSGEPWQSVKVGLCTGVVGGIALTRSVTDQRARLRRFGALGTATAAIVMMSALGLRAITDVRPAIVEMVASDERAARGYDAAVLRFRKGGITTRDLARMIDVAIRPPLQRASEQFGRLVDVPRADAPLVSDAQRYLGLRSDGWRARSEALRKGNMRRLKEADTIEQEALQALESLRKASSK